MIRCDNCQTDNRIGAVFCKSCGERLNLDNAEAQIQESHRRERRSPKRILGILRKLVGLALLAAVVLVMIGIFRSVPMAFDEHVSVEALKNGHRKLKLMQSAQPRSGNDPQLTFTEEEVTGLINQLANLREEEGEEEIEDPGFALSPQIISVEFLPSGFVRLILKSVSFKGVKIYNTLVGRLVSEDGNVRFDIQSARVGKVTMIGPLVDVVTDRFKANVDNWEPVEKAKAVVDYIEVMDGKAVVHLKRAGQ